MYESFFGLKEKPFNLTPDPDFLYLNKRTKEAFENILYGIERREGFAVIVGDVGTGKTTLCCALLEKIEGQKNIRTVLIQNPMLSEMDILRSILQDLGVRPERSWPEKSYEQPMLDASWARDMTKKELIDLLNTFLADRAREDAFTVLLIDESQNLSLEMLEQLRLLSNLETTKKKLLQIIFLGQPELKPKLATLRQLNQRISVRFETRALSREDTEKYIRHRLVVAGGANRIQFGRGAFDAIHKHSKGYPRLINMICDRGLLEAHRERSFTVKKPMIRRAVVSLAGNEDGLFRAPSRRARITAAVILILIAAASVLLFLFGKRLLTFEGSRAGARLQEKSVLVPANRPDEPKKQPAAEARMPAPALPQPQQASEYVLQIHSFRGADAADAAATQLNALNLPAFVQFHPGKEDDGWYGVYVGPFRDLETARRTESEVRAATGVSPVLHERAARQTKEARI